jgi:hypothetical protein
MRALAFGGKVKKLCWHSTFGEIIVEEVQLRLGKKRLRPFVEGAKVRHRGISRPSRREARIALAHGQGSQTLTYGGTLEGDAKEAGQILFDTAPPGSLWT